MLRVFQALVVAIILALLGSQAYSVYQWKVTTEARIAALEKEADAYKWLAEGVVKTPDGKAISRAQLLDLLLAKALKQPEAKPASAK